MKQIYRFDDSPPPILTEKKLRQISEQKKLKVQTIIISIAGLLMHLCLLLTGILLFPRYEALAIVCFAYLIIAVFGSAVTTIVFTRKGEIIHG